MSIKVATTISSGIVESGVLDLALGAHIGGWRIIRTLGHRLTEIEAPQGFVAEASAASTLLSASDFGYPLSTTQTVSGGILGVGIGKRLAGVRWGLAGQSGGITAICGQGIVSLERLADARRAGHTGAVVANGLVVALVALVCAGALVAGFLAMTHK